MPYRGIEKAAIFLISVGEEAASEIMKNLDMHQVGMITSYMNRLKSVKKKDLDEIISEVNGKIHSGDVHVTGEDYVKKYEEFITNSPIMLIGKVIESKKDIELQKS